MPYHVVKHDSRWCVEKADGSHKSMGCHDTEAEAKAQMAALYANEPKAARNLHLVGATGKMRTAVYDKREHLVVPVVAMVEGVVWAVNSDVPEFVPAEELAVSPQQWNGRGCFAGHPKDGGTQVTANTPRTLEQSFGLVFGASSAEQILATRRLELEAWLDPEKARQVGPEAVSVCERIRAGETVEVSVGCYVEAEQVDGRVGALEYHGIWRNIVSDHLAFLAEDQEGACSVAAGCGAPRSAVKHFVTAQGLRKEGGMAEPVGWLLSKAGEKPSRSHLLSLLEARNAQGPSVSDIYRAVDSALRAVEPGYLGIDTVFPEEKDVVYYVMPEETPMMKRRSYSLKDGKATLGDKAERVEAVTTYQPVKAASATTVPISVPAIKTTGGNKPPATGVKSAATLPQPRAAGCGCTNKGARTMSMPRAELIAALVTDKHSGFKDGDEAILEAASDARLDEFRSAADANRAAANQITKLETENRNVSARLKVAEDRLRVAESPMSEDDFRQRAPESIKAILDAVKAEDDQLRASLISQLKDLGAHSEEQLKNKPTAELKTLAAYARIEVPDFSGRGMPRMKAAEVNNDDFTPPDPYAAGLKAMQTSGKVN